jgi:hypothetical protein
MVVCVFACGVISLFSRKAELKQYVYIFDKVIGSCDYGDWGVPKYGICKLENQESWWCKSTECKGLTPSGADNITSFKAKGLGMERMRRLGNLVWGLVWILKSKDQRAGAWMSEGRRWVPFLHPFVLSWSSTNWLMPAYIDEGWHWCTDSILKYLPETQTHPVIMFLSAIWISFSPVNFTHKSNYHTWTQLNP